MIILLVYDINSFSTVTNNCAPGMSYSFLFFLLGWIVFYPVYKAATITDGPRGPDMSEVTVPLQLNFSGTLLCQSYSSKTNHSV